MKENISRLSKKVAIVTGASKGIGAAIATALGAAGARVAVNYSSDREGAERVAQAITDNGCEAIAVGADVSKAADVARLFKEVHSAFGRLDVLVNNAGVRGCPESWPPSSIRSSMAITSSAYWKFSSMAVIPSAAGPPNKSTSPFSPAFSFPPKPMA